MDFELFITSIFDDFRSNYFVIVADLLFNAFVILAILILSLP